MLADVFISYSSEDRYRIEPIVQLVRAMKKDSVFQDFSSIRPGDKWADKIAEALESCRTVLVFWCEHSSASDFVREEYTAAIAAKKEVMPILLDDTKLPGPLGAYQWLDFRREQPHGGLINFIPGVFRRSGRHFYPKDRHGEFRDWDFEHFRDDEHERRRAWEASQEARTKEIAHGIVERLTSPDSRD